MRRSLSLKKYLKILCSRLDTLEGYLETFAEHALQERSLLLDNSILGIDFCSKMEEDEIIEYKVTEKFSQVLFIFSEYPEDRVIICTKEYLLLLVELLENKNLRKYIKPLKTKIQNISKNSPS